MATNVSLPEGFSFTPPAEHGTNRASGTDDVVETPNWANYGAVQPSFVPSADGSLFVSLYGWLRGAVGQYVFRWPPEGAPEHIPTPFVTDGRGELYVKNGILHLASFHGKMLHRQALPESGYIDPERVCTCEDVSRPPKTSAMAALWRGPSYSAEHFDTPAETALRVDKQLRALNDLIDMVCG